MKEKHPAEIIAHTLKPREDNEITVKTAPLAICTFRLEKDPKGSSMILFADSDGFVSIYINPSHESEHISKFSLEYQVGGAAITKIIELRAHGKSTIEMPFPVVVSRPNTGSKIRPALSAEEIEKLTNGELRQRGYPMRPDPKESKAAFDLWIMAVTKPVTILPPGSVAHPFLTGGPPVPAVPQQSNNWSGFELVATPGTYNLVAGSWWVPEVVARPNQSDYSCVWIGIDDFTTYYPPAVNPTSSLPYYPPLIPGDIVQAGTLQNCNVFTDGGLDFSAHQYNAWTEVYPLQDKQQIVHDFQVRKGDLISMQVWVGNDVALYPTLTGGICFFQFENLTTSKSITMETTVEGRQHIQGATAMWMVECPLNTPTPPTLAKYGTVVMNGAFAYNQWKGSNVPYQGDVNWQYTMQVTEIDNSTTTLSTVSAIDTYKMEFTWQGYN